MNISVPFLTLFLAAILTSAIGFGRLAALLGSFWVAFGGGTKGVTALFAIQMSIALGILFVVTAIVISFGSKLGLLSLDRSWRVLSAFTHEDEGECSAGHYLVKRAELEMLPFSQESASVRKSSDAGWGFVDRSFKFVIPSVR